MAVSGNTNDLTLSERKEFIRTSLPGIDAKIIVNRNGTSIRGFLVHHETHVKLGGKTMRRIVKDVRDLPLKKKQLVNALVSEHQTRSSTNITVPSQTAPWSSAFRNLDQSARASLFQGWADSTAAATETYFQRILHALDSLDPTCITEEDLLRVKENLVNKAEKNARSRKDEATKFNVEVRLLRINIVLERLHQIIPNLPLVQFPICQTRHRQYREQVKSIPEPIRQRLFQLLVAMAKDGKPIALAVALMFFGGLRTGEAGAIHFSDIQISESRRYCYIFIHNRLDNSGELKNVLKTQNAYRCVVLPYAFLMIFEILQSSLTEQGRYNATELILGSDYQSLSQFSAATKQLLIDAGMTQEVISSLIDLMHREPDEVDGERITDPTAYILRRDWTTRAASCCGLTNSDLDYFLGHFNPALRKKDYLDPAVRNKIALKLENYVIDPQFSLHPGFWAAELTKKDQALIVKQTNRAKFHYNGPAPGMIRITVRSREPGDCIGIAAPRKPKKCRPSAIIEDVESRGNRTILGAIPSFGKESDLL